MTQPTTRPNVDIEEDIRDIISHYPPLQADRHQLRFDVADGVVNVSGHVRSLISRRYLADRIAEIPGVYAVNIDNLYSEETIRLEAGQRIPSGVIANATYGTLILTGALPSGETSETIASRVAQIRGVERVITKF